MDTDNNKHQCGPKVDNDGGDLKQIFITCGFTGRIIRMEKDGIITLCEVEAFGRAGFLYCQILVI